MSGSPGRKSRNPKPEEIDALLDQVEKKYLKSPEARKLAETPPQSCPCTVKHPTDWNEVDEMLKDFKFEDNNPFAKSKNKPWARQKLEPLDGEEDNDMKKCFTIFLAGSFETMGYSVPGVEKPCSSLKCIRCDFSVLSFDNYAWHPSTDYLFLRNNVPDFDKLADKLCRKKGSRAYACQCQHVTVSSLISAMSRPELRWVCGKHSIKSQVP